MDLIAYALHLPVGVHEDYWKCRLTDEEKESIAALFKRRIEERLPAAYLTQEAWFAGRPYYVDERVLVPRSPFAELIDQGFEGLVETPERVLDLCTGSGCIGMAIAKKFPSCWVDCADISPEALAVAEINLYAHHLEHQVRLVESDLFGGLPGERYDLIVCNPPYVDEDEIAQMPQEYRAEPLLGLASGFDGLDFTRQLLAQATDYLHEEGVLLVEVGASWSNLVYSFPEVPFEWVALKQGGEGIFKLTRAQLLAHRDVFENAVKQHG
jgi:ribosomal protein L3 glutamine methyltransferase